MKTDHIQQLIDKFFKGETTLEEEQWLETFFVQEDIPEAWKKYQSLFVDIGAIGRLKPKDVKAVRMEEPIRIHRERHPRWKVIHRKMILQVAAISLILIGATFTWNLHQKDQLAQRYGGSYVIENGKRNDNLLQIKSQIERTIADANQIEQKVEGQDFINKTEEDVINHIDDPTEKARIKELLKE